MGMKTGGTGGTPNFRRVERQAVLVELLAEKCPQTTQLAPEAVFARQGGLDLDQPRQAHATFSRLGGEEEFRVPNFGGELLVEVLYILI